MNAESRDSILRMLLPAILVGAAYVTLFNRSGELEAANKRLEAARASAPDPFALQQASVKMAKTAGEKAEVEAEKTALDGQWSQLLAFPATSPAKRAAALRQLTRMLWDRGLYPFEESPAEGSGQLPASFDDVLKRLATAGAPTQPRLWKVSFYGRYSDVVDTLALIGDTDVGLVPVGLTMSEARPETSWRIWTLLLWN